MLVGKDDPALYMTIARHRLVLEQQPARHNLILGFLTRVPQMPVTEEVRFWSFETQARVLCKSARAAYSWARSRPTMRRRLLDW
jgi:hypothetical protein